MTKIILNVIIILIFCLISCGESSKSENNPDTKADTANEEKPFDAHKSHSKLHFTDNEMDFAFALILGATGNGGCEIGEAFYAANRIKEGEAASWQEEWLAMAERAKKRGDNSLEGDHRISAGNQFLKASYYYRAALVSMMPDDNRFIPTAGKSREMLRKAGKLMSPEIEYFEIPFEDTFMPGFFRKAKNDNIPRKTLIMVGGGETFAEDLYFYIAEQAHIRNYNFMTIDLPGQGLLPTEGKFFRADVETPMKSVVDYALSRKDVDPEKLAMYGISGGGGFVPRSAQYDERIKAIAMNSAVVDAKELFASMPVVSATNDIVETWSSFKQNTVKVIAWRWGVDMNNIPALVEANTGFSFDPEKVFCPTLVLVGEGEYENEEVQKQQKICMDNLAAKIKKFVITPANEGASNHCITENHSVMSQVVFDFFDDIFK